MFYITGTGNTSVTNMQTVTVKKEPEDIPSTSQQAQQQIHIQQQQPQTIAVSVAPNQATHTIVEAAPNANGNQPQHIVTQHENSDGSTSLQIQQVQNLPGTHQLTLSNLNQVNFYPLLLPFFDNIFMQFCPNQYLFQLHLQPNKNHILVKKVIFVKGNNANT